MVEVAVIWHTYQHKFLSSSKTFHQIFQDDPLQIMHSYSMFLQCLPSFPHVLLPITMSLLLIKEWAGKDPPRVWAVEKVEWSGNKKCRRGKEGLCDHSGKGEKRLHNVLVPQLFPENLHPRYVLFRPFVAGFIWKTHTWSSGYFDSL